MWPFGRLTLKMLADKIVELGAKRSKDIDSINKNFIDLNKVLQDQQTIIKSHHRVIEELINMLRQAGVIGISGVDDAKDEAKDETPTPVTDETKDKKPKKETVH